MLIPFVGRRYYNSAPDAGTYGYYWSSSPYGDAYEARGFDFNAGNLRTNRYNGRGYGYAVRCFKNSYIELPKAFNLYFMTNTGDSIGDEI